MVNAIAVLKGADVSGVVKFSQASEDSNVVVEASFTGLKPGKHGFHIHEFGDNTNGKFCYALFCRLDCPRGGERGIDRVK